MSSVSDFLKLESAFTVLQFAIVAPLIAFAYRGASVGQSQVVTAEGARAP